MDRFNALGRGAQIMLVAGVLLLIDTFLPWQDFDVGGVDIVSWNAWRGFLGVVLGLLTIALVVWLVLRVMDVALPLPISGAMIAAILGGLVLVFAVIKNLNDEESTLWSYLGVLLAIAIAVGAWMEIQAAGGIETLKSEIPSGSTSSGTQTSATTTATPVSTPTPEAAPPPVEPIPPAKPMEPEGPTEPSDRAEPEAPYDPDERRDV
jgi:hypothetical protein